MPDFGALLQAAASPRPVARSTRSSRSSASSSFAHVRTSDADSGESLAGSIGSRGGVTRLRLIRTDEEAFVSKCRHAIGNRGQDQNQVPTKLCLKSKVETREDCGTEHRGELHVLEPNSLYISAGPNKLYSRPHLACSFLQEDFIQNLLEQSKEMSVWNALFTDISNAVQDEGTDHTLSADTFERWQTGLSKPLQTPARIRTRAITSPSAGSVLTEDADDEMGNMPPTPEVPLNFILEESVQQEWRDGGLPESLIAELQSLHDAVEGAASASVALHRDFSGIALLQGRDIRHLDVRLQSAENSLGSPTPVPGVIAGNLWAATAVLGGNLESVQGGDAAGIDALSQDVQAFRTRTHDRVAQLETGLADVIALIGSYRDNFDILEAQIETLLVPDRTPEHGTASSHVSVAEEALGTRRRPVAVEDRDVSSDMQSQMDSLKAEMTLVKRAVDKKKGFIQSFPDILPGVNTQQDVYAWVTANFGGGNGDGDDSNDSVFDDLAGEGVGDPTYAGFSDIYSAFAVFEDLNSVSTKGETLQELDRIHMAGVKHPFEAIIIYSLKKIVPGIFGEGLPSGTSSHLVSVKDAIAWDSDFSDNPDCKPGLKQILEERLEEVESQIKEVIASSYTRKGLTGPADLAKDMLTKTMKFLKLILNEISRVNRNLTSRSGYSLMEAWCLVTQTFRGIFVYIGKARTAIRSLSPKDPPALNTARVLHVMLRTHDLMDEFVQAEIKNHPIVSSEYVKFLATHSGRREIAEVRTEVKNLSTMCSANQSMLAKLKKKD